MTLSSQISKKYLFSKKENNFINVISLLTMITFGIGCAILIIILSVFNGLQGVVEGMFNKFNPDVKIMPVTGKTFHIDSSLLSKIKEIEGVKLFTPVIEETALFVNDNAKVVAKLKGLNYEFLSQSRFNALLEEKIELPKNGIILGANALYNLNINLDDPFAAVDVLIADKDYKPLPGKRPMKRQIFKPQGFFQTNNAEYDLEYAFVNLSDMQNFLGHPNVYSHLEIYLQSPESEKHVRNEILKILNKKEIQIQNIYEQEESYYKLLKLEKWVAFIITIFVLLLILFNLMACLWIIVIEKTKDIAILKAMGLVKSRISKIIYNLGFMYCMIGGAIGLTLGIVIVLIQQYFGVLTMGANYVVDAYPVQLKWIDVILILVTIFILGIIASFPSAKRAESIDTNFTRN